MDDREKGRRSRCHPYLISIAFNESQSDVNRTDLEVLKIKKKESTKNKHCNYYFKLNTDWLYAIILPLLIHLVLGMA